MFKLISVAMLLILKATTPLHRDKMYYRPKNDFTKSIVCRQNEKNTQDFNVHIDEVMNAISPGSLNDKQHHLLNDFGNLLVFWGNHLYMLHFKDTRLKYHCLADLNEDSWLIIEYHFHPIVHMPWLFHFIIIFFCLCVRANTSIAFCFDPLAFGLFYCTFSIFLVYCFGFFSSWCFDVFCDLPVDFFF